MIWLILTIAVWGAVHSWLASSGVKAYVARISGSRLSRFYRLAYNAFSVISLAPVLILMRLLPDRMLYIIPPPWLFVTLALQAAAAILLVVILLQTDAASFIGLRQVFRAEAPGALVTDGFYGWVRHPLYLFGLLIIWLTPIMTLNIMVVDVALTVYLFVGAAFEERKLAREFGSAYEQYRQRTPMILPLMFRIRRRG